MNDTTKSHQCDRGQSRPLTDARGIFCCYICPQCEAEKRSRFRVAIFTDPNYEADDLCEDK